MLFRLPNRTVIVLDIVRSSVYVDARATLKCAKSCYFLNDRQGEMEDSAR